MRCFFLFFTCGFLHRQLVVLVSFDIPCNLVVVASGVTLTRVCTLLAYCKCSILFKRLILSRTHTVDETGYLTHMYSYTKILVFLNYWRQLLHE